MSGLGNPAKWLLDFFRGMSDDEYEQRMTAEAALKYAPVWYAVTRIAGHIGQLPTVLHKRKNGGAEPAKTHPAYRLIKARPNDYQSASVFKEQLHLHALLYGNGRALIVRESGRPVELLPLCADRTDTLMVKGEKWHITILHSEVDGIPKTQGSIYKEYPNAWAFPDKDVLHVMGLSIDGFKGLNLADYAARSFGLGMSGEKGAANASKKGFQGSLMLQAPVGAFRKEEDAKRFLEEFKQSHAGEQNAGAIGLLREGITANVVSHSAKDMEQTMSRQFQRQEVALWFLLEHILGDESATSYASLVERNLAYLSNCLGRWIKRWEEECDEKLLTDSQKFNDSHFFRFSTGALLKTDMQTTATTLNTLITSTILNRNECRSLLDYNEVEGGDEFANPATSSPASEPDDDEETESDSANEMAVQSRLKHMIEVEANRVRNGTKAANFCNWVEDFYSRWEPKLADVCEEIGLDRELATAHCAESMRRLFEIADTTTQDMLSETVENCVKTWENRVFSFKKEPISCK